MKKFYRHRLVLLLGILVALTFFYLGVNTWMSAQEKRATPPPIVSSKPAVAPPPKPTPNLNPKPADETPKPRVIKPSHPLSETPTERVEKPKEEIKEKANKSPQEQTQKKLKEYIVQIGAFKLKKNADARLKLAKEKGFEVFMIEEDGLYKVRVRVEAKSSLSALRETRNRLGSAFIVK